MSDTRSLGEWNAYVEAGRSREERARRLAEVPEELRAQVAAHVRTCWELRAAQRETPGSLRRQGFRG